VVYAADASPAAACQWATLDLPGFSRTSASALVMKDVFHGIRNRDEVAVRLSDDTHRLVAWLPGADPDLMLSCRLEDGGFGVGSRVEKSYQWLAPSADGKHFFTLGGMVDLEGNYDGRRNTRLACFPILGKADQFLLYDASDATFRQYDLNSRIQGQPVKSQNPELPLITTGKLTPDRRVVASGPAGRFAVIMAENRTIYIYALPSP
jgi:hypothetical protein